MTDLEDLGWHPDDYTTRDEPALADADALTIHVQGSGDNQQVIATPHDSLEACGFDWMKFSNDPRVELRR